MSILLCSKTSASSWNFIANETQFHCRTHSWWKVLCGVAWDFAMGELGVAADGCLVVQEWQCQAMCSRSFNGITCFGLTPNMEGALAFMADREFFGLDAHVGTSWTFQGAM